MAENRWNPRYLAYCAATGGRSPGETLARDDEQYPGGKMCGFMLWIQGKWSEFLKLNPIIHREILSNEDHAAFDAWLARKD